MLRIRLTRTGRKKQPMYRIVVVEKSQAAKSGKFVELLGHYNATAKPKTLKLNLAKYKHWCAKGAKPTRTVEDLVKKFK